MLSAQSVYGSVVGNVADTSGAAITGTTVTLRNTGTHNVVTTTSDAIGAYRFLNLLPGNYQVEYSAAGFAKIIRSQVTLQVQQALRLDVVLPPGQQSEVVEVSGEVSQLQSESASLAQVIDSRTVQEMPLNGRNVMNLVALAPGVVGQGGAQGQGAIANSNGGGATNANAFGNYQIGGGIANQSATYLDGVPLNGSSYNSVLLVPTQDVVQEFNVATSNPSADSGRSGGGIVSFTTKPGTSQFHGSAYEYFRNNIFNANSFFNNQAGIRRGKYNQNQYGGNVGGPILKNKLFFFAAWEGERFNLAIPTNFSVPTNAELGGDFSATGLPKIYDPLTVCGFYGNAACPIVNGLPVYTRKQFPGNIIPTNRFDVASNVYKNFFAPANLPGFVNNFQVNEAVQGSQEQTNGRIDDTISDKDSLFAHYAHWGVNILPVNAYFNAPIVGSHNLLTTDTAVVGNTYILSPTTVIDGRLGFLRFVQINTPNSPFQQLSQFGPGWVPLQSQIATPAYPSAIISGLFSLANSQNFITNANDIYVLSANVTKTLGRHTIKFGGEARRVEWYYSNTASSNGQFTFDNGYTALNPQSPSGSGVGFASFLLGTPSSAFATESRTAAQYHYYDALYVQDSFHLTRHLLLTTGLRWDVVPGELAEKHGDAAVFIPGATDPLIAQPNLSLHGQVALVNSSLYGNNTIHPTHSKLFAPRIGFSYSADDKTVFRGGYGLMYLPNTLGIQDAPWSSPPNSGTTNMITSLNGNITPYNFFANPFPNGLVQPAGRNATALSAVVEGSSFTAPLPGISYPYTQQWNFNVERQLPGGIFFEAGYAASKGTHLLFNGSPNLNQLPDQYDSLGAALTKTQANPFYGTLPLNIGTLAQATVTAGQLDRTYPQFLNVINPAAYGAGSNYQSLQVKGEKRFSKHGGILSGNYTWAKLLSNTDSLNTALESPRVVGTPQDWTNPQADKSLESFDVRSRGILSYVYELPFGHGQLFLNGDNGLVSRLVGGWEVSGTTTFQAGFPVAFTSTATVLSSTFGAGTPRPNRVAGCDPRVSGSATLRLTAWFNTACFTGPSQYGFGNESRTDSGVRAAGIDNTDIAISKSTTLAEPVSLMLRLESFNTFNRTQFGAPAAQFGATTFGTVASQINSPRLLQVSARFVF